jgi:hypothetical protein
MRESCAWSYAFLGILRRLSRPSVSLSSRMSPAISAITSGLSIEVERVDQHATVHGDRGPRVYVRIRPAASEPGRDNGPHTCLTLTNADAQAFGLLLQQAGGQ